MSKKAIIFGVSGQDGSYLAEYLLSNGYSVIGTIRRSSSFNTWRIDQLYGNRNFTTVYADVTDSSNVSRLILTHKPDEIYNLSAQSHVGVSFELPEYTADVDALGVTKLLEAVKNLQLSGHDVRFYQASTSELFGGEIGTTPQSLSTPMHPKSPYAAAKLYAYWMVKTYREAFGLYACNGILFNHESSRRGENFVTQKVISHVAKKKLGRMNDILKIGNLDAIRDWGCAQEYVRSMHLMLQHHEPHDFVVGTGIGTSVRKFIEMAFSASGIELVWRGSGLSETAIDRETGETLVAVDERYFRPSEVHNLIADPSETYRILGWKPTVQIAELVQAMYNETLEAL